MKKLIALLLVCTMVFGMIACTSKPAAAPAAAAPAAEAEAKPTEAAAEPVETKVYRCSTNHAEGFNVSVALHNWSDTVYEKTNGRIKIEIYYDAVLGDEKSAIEQCQYGGLEFARVNISPMCEFMSGFNALTMPFIYANDEHFWKVMETKGMELMHSDELKSAGFYGLTWYDGGSRNFYNSKKEIHTPADMAGMNIRVQESNLMIGMIEALGAVATAMPYGDVYSGLQTGVIDGAENSIVQYLEVSHYEVAPFITLDGHTRAADMLIMSEKVRQELDPADVAIIEEAAIDSWKMQRGLWADDDAVALGKLIDAGVTVTELTSDEYQAFKAACEPLWKSYEGGKYYDIIQEVVGMA